MCQLINFIDKTLFILKKTKKLKKKKQIQRGKRGEQEKHIKNNN